MTDWAFSVVLIVPAALQAKANLLSCALGHDVLPGNTYSVPLSAPGNEPATHFGCRAQGKQEFLDILQGAGQGQLPEELDLEAFGLTPQDVGAVVQSLIFDARPANEMSGHFDAVTADRGLMRVMPEDVEDAA